MQTVTLRLSNFSKDTMHQSLLPRRGDHSTPILLKEVAHQIPHVGKEEKLRHEVVFPLTRVQSTFSLSKIKLSINWLLYLQLQPLNNIVFR